MIKVRILKQAKSCAQVIQDKVFSAQLDKLKGYPKIAAEAPGKHIVHSEVFDYPLVCLNGHEFKTTNNGVLVCKNCHTPQYSI